MTALEPVPTIRPNHGGWIPINLADEPDQPPVPPDLGGFGIIYRGKRHVFSGPQESAKTIAAYAIGLETLRSVPNRYICIIDFEMGKRAARTRLRELGATNNELARILYIEPEAPANKDRIRMIVEHRPTLVIIDAAAGAYSLQGLNDNDRGDVERFTQLYVDEFFRNTIASLVLDHVVKNAENRSKYAIGSERKTGGVDVHLGFDTILPIKRGSHGLYKITTHKDRDGWHERGRLADLYLESDPVTHQIRWEWRQAEHLEDPNQWLPTIYMERVSKYLQDDGEPCSRKHLEDNVEGGTDYIRDAAKHLARLGYVTETRGARKAWIYTHLKLFTQTIWADDPQNTHLATSPDLASTSPEARTIPPRHLASPTRGGEDGEVNVAANNGTTSPDDPETLAMLAHYDLLEPPHTEQPDDDDIPF